MFTDLYDILRIIIYCYKSLIKELHKTSKYLVQNSNTNPQMLTLFTPINNNKNNPIEAC